MVVKQLVAGYAAMVGVPLLILLIVFNAGSELVAPPAIEGAWTMQPASPAMEEGCPQASAGGAGGALVISQSGRHLRAHWTQDKARALSGVMDERHFVLCSASRSNEECSVDPRRLEGRILEEDGARRLEVRLPPESDSKCKELILQSSWREIERELRTFTESKH
jgi:hypothetical protein